MGEERLHDPRTEWLATAAELTPALARAQSRRLLGQKEDVAMRRTASQEDFAPRF